MPSLSEEEKYWQDYRERMMDYKYAKPPRKTPNPLWGLLGLVIIGLCIWFIISNI